MDTPINMAHQQDRKAEALLIAGKHQEAIICHQKAADYLLEAMKMTSVPKALTSMELQFQKHLKEQKILRYKWERFKQQQEKMKRDEGTDEKNKEVEPSQVSPSFDVTDYSHNFNSHAERGPDGQQASNLNFFEQNESGNLVISTDHLSVFSISSADSMTSSTKDEKSTSLGVNTHVHDLEMQVLALSQALEDANRENTRLKNTLTRLVETVKERFGFEIDPEVIVNDVKEVDSELTITDSFIKWGEDNGHEGPTFSENLAELPPLELPTYELS